MLAFEGPSAKCIDTNAGALSCLFLPFRPLPRPLPRPPGSRGKLRAQTTVIRKRPSSKCNGLASSRCAKNAPPPANPSLPPPLPLRKTCHRIQAQYTTVRTAAYITAALQHWHETYRHNIGSKAASQCTRRESQKGSAPMYFAASAAAWHTHTHLSITQQANSPLIAILNTFT